MKINSLSFLYFLAIIALSTQNMNAAECTQCMVLRNDLLASLLKQKDLTVTNLELMNQQRKLLEQYDTLADLNVQLTRALSNVLRIQGVHTKRFILPKSHTIEYKGFYFTDDRHKFIYQHAPSQNNSLTN